MTEWPVHSEALDEVRQRLFPDLPPEAGWARIDAAFAGAADEERWGRIERVAEELNLTDELLEQLRRARR